MQKGNIFLIALILTTLVGVGGYYAYKRGNISIRSDADAGPNYTLNSLMPEPSSGTAGGENSSTSVSTSGDIGLTITSPVSGTILKSGTVTVTGKTSPNAEVFVNDASTKADVNGNFTINLSLDEGENNLVITANDSEGNVAEQTVSVNIQTY